MNHDTTTNTYNVPILPGDTWEDVQEWLIALEASDLLWHMDDDAHAIVWHSGGTPSAADLDKLEADRLQAIAICEAAEIDIFDLYPVDDPTFGGRV